VSEDAIRQDTRRLAESSGIDAAPKVLRARGHARAGQGRGAFRVDAEARHLQHGAERLTVRRLGQGNRSPAIGKAGIGWAAG
jgi:hypothetical protein